MLVECPGCKNQRVPSFPLRLGSDSEGNVVDIYLTADHLGWFKFSTEDGKNPTVEDILNFKGEKIRRGSLGAGGVVEYYD